MNNLEIYCVTDIQSIHLENLGLKLAGVGKNNFPNGYMQCLNGENINHKEKNYSQLTFYYWFWKNKLLDINENLWVGFCQKRRFWLSSKSDIKIKDIKELKKKILKEVPSEWNEYNSVLCNPITVSKPKLMKLFKRGWKNLIKDPTILLNKNKQNIKLQFDLHHGYGLLDKSIKMLPEKDRLDFINYVNNNTEFNPHIMFISKKKILDMVFKDLFEWLFECEKIFGLENLTGYDQTRIYAYLSERYLPFWFKKYSKPIDWPWGFLDISKIS